MNRTEKYIQRVLEQMQSPPDEREEMREEIQLHLEEAKERYVNEGLSERQAEKQALADFGKPNKIGQELQESMYPYQRGLLYAIGFAMIFFGVIFYLNETFLLHESVTGWLAIQLFMGTMVTLAALNIGFVGKYFYLLNLLIMVSIALSGFDLMMMETLPMGQSIFFGIYLVSLIICSFIFVFRNSYYSTGKMENKQHNSVLVKFSYVMNLLFGVMVIGIGLFFMWALAIFAGLSPITFLPLLSIIVWLIFLKFQMGFVAKKPMVSLATGLLFSAVAVVLPYMILLLR
ncbi:permease prefix domain 1-containing protein [Lentibacillus sp. N15]|uniref:permease prefix domain 1-containing protein n=1 Tax=Lentibacillus songyuanensis TaxID=3136161 RepID=UPI0031BA432E